MYFVRSPAPVSKDGQADAEEAWWQVARGAVLRFFEAFLEVRLGILAWSQKSCNILLRCLLRYVLSNSCISRHFTFANGLQICVDAYGCTLCISMLRARQCCNSRRTPNGSIWIVAQGSSKVAMHGYMYKTCSETLPESILWRIFFS